MERDTGVQDGGDILGRGSYGCVFSPPLVCKSSKGPPLHGTSIDKLATIATAEQEYDIGKRIRSLPLWKHYFLIAESICEPAPARDQPDKSFRDCKIVDPEHMDRYRLLRMRYGGRSLTSYRMDFAKHSMYDFARHLIEGGAILTLFGIAHMDLHSSNVVVDSENVPRIIDFNLAVDVKHKKMRLSREYMPELVQISPDNSLVKATVQKRGGPAIQDILTTKRNIHVLSSVLGISTKEQREQLTQFYKISTSAQQGNVQKWFSHYWRVQDSWAIGILLATLFGELNRWPSFAQSEYASYSNQLLPVLRKMCAPSPRKRIDCVQALHELEPTHYLFRTFPKANEWLAKVKTL